MQTDIGGWTTRLTEEAKRRYAQSGAWANVTLWQRARELAAREPDRTLVVDGEQAWTPRQLVDEAQRLAAALRAAGLQPGQVISFQLPNWREAVVINLAACLNGLVVNPIVPIYREKEVGFILRDCRAQVFFIPAAFRGFDYMAMARALKPALPELKQVVVVRGDAGEFTNYEALLAHGEGAPAAPAVDAHAVKLLMYTSGTTGNPKGVLHNHNTIMCEINACAGFWGLNRDDVVLMPSPVTHITGYLYALEATFALGLRAVLMEKWNAAEAVGIIARRGVTFSVGATPFLQELADEIERQRAELPSMRMFMSGGAPVPPELVYRANRLLPQCSIFRVYGSTEAPTITLGIADRRQAGLGATTDGRIVNNEVRLAGADGKTVTEGEGEICARGPELMLGYTDWQQTLQSFDDEGYFHTGDLGYYVQGEYLCVSGRKKDLIIRGGENISPKEIEDVLHTSGDIQEAAIVAYPHARLGEGVCAFVIPKGGSRPSVATLAAHLDKHGMAKQKWPERVEIVDDLPRTASGKVQKNLLRDRVAALVRAERGAQS
jgi:acyl-CoA synthetase (AMP-forming)/AMP-acid ligase II